MTDRKTRSGLRRLDLSLDVWAVVTALVLAGLVWANLLPPIPW
ncbi:MAG TPA: hypothetical protein VF930_03040 [Stellaceae bacterium]